MKKQHNRQRPNQKKQRKKVTQPVTSSNRLEDWSRAYQARNALHVASMTAVIGAALGRVYR
jgi:hypothetical protein